MEQGGRAAPSPSLTPESGAWSRPPLGDTPSKGKGSLVQMTVCTVSSMLDGTSNPETHGFSPRNGTQVETGGVPQP